MSPDATSGGLLSVASDLRRAAAERDPWLAGLRLAGIGWGTVELERAAEELGNAFAAARLPAPDWAPAVRDAHLGAAAWVGTTAWFGTDGPPRGLADPELPCGGPAGAGHGGPARRHAGAIRRGRCRDLPGGAARRRAPVRRRRAIRWTLPGSARRCRVRSGSGECCSRARPGARTSSWSLAASR